jgi:hypothetical protein
VGAVRVGTVYVGSKDLSVVHLDGNIPIDVHLRSHFRPEGYRWCRDKMPSWRMRCRGDEELSEQFDVS